MTHMLHTKHTLKSYTFKTQSYTDIGMHIPIKVTRIGLKDRKQLARYVSLSSTKTHEL